MLSRPGLARFCAKKRRSVRRLVVVENMHAVVNGKHYRLCNCNVTIVNSGVLSWGLVNWKCKKIKRTKFSGCGWEGVIHE